jgi:hypothetical protein
MDKVGQKSIQKMIGALMKLSDQQWSGYAFDHEPLERKFSTHQKQEYTQKAIACGTWEAKILMKKYPGMALTEIAAAQGFTIQQPDIPNGGGHVVFAQYEEPDTITIFMDCVKKAEALVSEQHIRELNDISIKQMLLAHELFHGIEYQKRKTIYTQTERIELWRRPFTNKSKILCLSEMAAMAFTKSILALSFLPYLLDVLLMYCYNADAATALYDEIIEAAKSDFAAGKTGAY